MKAFLLFVCFAVGALAQAPASRIGGPKVFAKSSASLEVKAVAAKKTTTDDFKTDYGSYDKTFVRSRSLAIKVTNFNAAQPFNGQVTLYWLGRRGPGGGNRIVIGKPSVETVTLAAKQTKAFDADSGLVTASDLRLRAIGIRETGGLKLEGWMVVLQTADGQAVAVKASAAAIEDDFKRGLLDSLAVEE